MADGAQLRLALGGRKLDSLEGDRSWRDRQAAPPTGSPRTAVGRRGCWVEAIGLPLRDLPRLQRGHRAARRYLLEPLVLRELGHRPGPVVGPGQPDSVGLRVVPLTQR